MEHEVTLTAENFASEIEQFSGVALVDIWADWCPPCRAMSPIVEKIAEQYAENSLVKICKLDNDQNEELVERFKVRSIPTFLFFKEGKLVHTEIGAMSPAKLLTPLEGLLSPA